jgi:DNA-binding HxlR family transcriptional regulator
MRASDQMRLWLSPDHRLVLSPRERRRTLATMKTTGMTAEAGDLEMIHGTRAVLDLLAAKWSVDILYLLATGTRRYSEVLYEVGEISKKTLTQTLRTLERGGLIARRVLPEVPARVEYSLTPLGWSLTEPLMAMYEWAAQHLPGADPYGAQLAA